MLYVSGLLRWLCKIGKVKDRVVNLAAIKPKLLRLKTLLLELIALAIKHTPIAYAQIRDWISKAIDQRRR